MILSFLQYIDLFDFVDKDKLGISAHSLGTEAGMALSVLCDDIKAMVFNDFLHNDIITVTSIPNNVRNGIFVLISAHYVRS